MKKDGSSGALAIAVLAVLVMLGLKKPNGNGGLAQLSGTVKSNTGAGIPGAAVNVGGNTATTDGSGNFAGIAVDPGTYTVVVSAAGYQTSSTSRTFVAGSNTLNIVLTAQAAYPALPLGAFNVMIDVGNAGLIQGEVVRLITEWGGASPNTAAQINDFVYYRSLHEHFSYNPDDPSSVQYWVLHYLGQYVTDIVYHGT